MNQFEYQILFSIIQFSNDNNITYFNDHLFVIFILKIETDLMSILCTYTVFIRYFDCLLDCQIVLSLSRKRKCLLLNTFSMASFASVDSEIKMSVSVSENKKQIASCFITIALYAYIATTLIPICLWRKRRVRGKY